MKNHSAYYIFMSYNIRNKLGTKEYLAEKVAQYESRGKFYDGEYELLLDLLEETFQPEEVEEESTEAEEQ